jgi:hypothetical protein
MGTLVCASSPLPTAHSRACVCVSVCVCVCVCVCVFDKCLVRMSCAKMWACATQNRQPAAPAADCRTRTHPLTAWWRLDRHQAVNRGRSQRPLSSNSISIAMPAPCFTKTRRHLEMPPGSTMPSAVCVISNLPMGVTSPHSWYSCCSVPQRSHFTPGP